MKTLVIYDITGKIYLILYGEETAPQGLPSIFVDIPEGAQLERIDVTNPAKPKPVFTYLPDSDFGILQKKVDELKETTEELTTETTAIKNVILPSIDTENCTLDELKDFTLNQFGNECSAAIYLGSDVETNQGLKHFSYNEADQRNLKAASDLAITTGLQVPYHADKEDCCLWDAIDIIKIYGTNEMLKSYQTTYCNLMNGIIRNKTDKESILSLSYGDELPTEQKTKLDSAMAQTQTIYETLIASATAKLNI